LAETRSILAAVVACFIAIGTAQAASNATNATAPLGPYILADAETGEVFEHSDALRPWYPASTTKLMTVYVAFRAIRAGEATMETPVIVSARAAAEPPSKMGFQPGTVLTLQNAIRIMMVKSANDIATAVAETIGGSETGFSARMNAEAARIGMSRSHFVNAHGLPDKGNVTTVRDMALLARTLLVDFPEYRDYFKIHAIRFGDKTLKNYNTLIDRYPGANGMKTGFICASGFNLVATARRGGREVIAVVFGAYGGKERAEHAAGLLEAGFKAGGLFGGSKTNLDNVSSGRTYTTPIDMRPYICSGNRAASASEADESEGNSGTQRAVLGPPIYLGPPVQVSIISSGAATTAVAAAQAGAPRLPRPRPDRAGFQSPGVASAFAPNRAEPEDPLKAVIDSSRPDGPTLNLYGD
jgi:D-alanyl-D-alanine carboxypeptidase